VIDLPAYAACGLSAATMGRGLTEDPLFFGSALAGGSALGELAAHRDRGEPGDRSAIARPDAGAAVAEAKLQG
jgi:hypothetical protein